MRLLPAPTTCSLPNELLSTITTNILVRSLSYLCVCVCVNQDWIYAKEILVIVSSLHILPFPQTNFITESLCSFPVLLPHAEPPISIGNPQVGSPNLLPNLWASSKHFQSSLSLVPWLQLLFVPFYNVWSSCSKWRNSWVQTKKVKKNYTCTFSAYKKLQSHKYLLF